MHQSSRLVLAVTALTLASSSAAFAQSTPSSPMPMSTGSTASPMPPMTPGSGPMTMPPMTPTGMSTSSPSSAPAATAAPSNGGSPNNGSSNGSGANVNANIKKIQNGSLTRAQVVYGLTHQVQAAKQLLTMKTVNFDNLRVYRLPATLKSVLKVSDADTQAIALAMLGDGVRVAQTTPSLPSSNGNNSPIQYLRNVLANINVSNALNNLNVLNNSNVNLNVALSNVLNNNKISIGQVVGLYIGGGGIITTITK